MAWSYNKATDTLTVWGGTAEAPITLDDFDGELDISADPIVVKDTTAVPEGGYTGSADAAPVVGGNLATRLYAEKTGSPNADETLDVNGTDAWSVSKQALIQPPSMPDYFVQRLQTIDASGIGATRGVGDPAWSFTITQRQVQRITKTVNSYLVHCNLVVGDGTNATHLASVGELVRFTAGKTLKIASNATLRLGEASDSWGRNGSAWTIAPSAAMDLIASGATNAAFEQYASLFRVASNYAVSLRAGTWTARNAITSGCYQPAGNTGCQIVTYADVSLDWKRVQVANFGRCTMQGSTLTLYEDVHLHGNQVGMRMLVANMELLKPRVTGYVDNDYLAESVGTNFTFGVLDPVNNVAAPSLVNYGAVTTKLLEKYTCNMTLVDADGDPVEGVTVKCYDQYDSLVFEADTDEDGAIAEQEITYKQWEKVGAAATVATTYSPHRFTFEKTGYQTLTMDQVTVDSPIAGGIDWRVPMMAPAAGGGKVVNVGMQT